MEEILLASGSPRRAELIGLINVIAKIETRPVEEIIDNTLSPQENTKALALLKAEAVAKEFPDKWVIGADTIVCCEGKIMGKPKDEEDAKRILALLSDKTHEVCTGVAIINESKKYKVTFVETTKVKMKKLSSFEIEDYVSTGEPLDKAGAYGIQGKGALYIEGIEGDYYNVMGLPVHRLYEAFIKLNIV